MMLPMSVRCKTCGEFMKIGTKFNMRKATVEDEDYLGIAIYRFHWKCKRCSGELTMKTDPKNSDYVCEFGATRNYEPWRDQRCAETAKAAVRKLEEQNDILKSLENKTYDSKREMEILDNLEEVRHLNKRHANVNHEDMIEASRKQYMQSLQEDVLQKDAKEQFSKLRRKREEMMEQDAIFERKEEDDESSGDEGIMGMVNINKREMKSMVKPDPIKSSSGPVFKRPAVKLNKRVKVTPKPAEPAKEVKACPNPLEMLAGLGSDSDSD
uniref:Splicing factor YJU2 n=1 Tax=Euplotes crassus TaxID=5936 RepID=A0A7S3KK23_EUPCR|mmetsp:Transcript_28128/g.27930  ORF Transcript_28128/g.27930 Transcript_28128/m.27930 type:complete len:268 (+) Transcript_28128:137-940(+)